MTKMTGCIQEAGSLCDSRGLMYIHPLLEAGESVEERKREGEDEGKSLI